MILSLDLGSTSFKAAVYDRRLRRCGLGVAPLRYCYGAGGRVELAVKVVDATLQRAIRDALDKAGCRAGGLTAVGLTSQAQTFTVMDARGRPARPFVSWQDNRAGVAARQLRRALPGFATHTSFGQVLSALQVCQLRHAPVARGDCVLPLPSYALWRWSGEVVTDNNLAAMSGLYSLPLGDWWPAACRAARIAPAQLPRVVTVGDVGARTTSAAGRYGLPAGLPVVLAGNDQTAGAYAARLEGTGAVLITLGTAQVVYTHCRELPAPGVGTVRGPYPGGGYYLLTCDAVGGNLVNWAETVLAGCGTDAAFFAHAARAPVGDNGLWLDVAFDGATWGWAGLRLNHTAGDLARAVIEALCRRLAILVASHGGLRARRRVFAAGGGSRQPFWRQLLARELGVRVVPTTADPLLGAARLAARQ